MVTRTEMNRPAPDRLRSRTEAALLVSMAVAQAATGALGAGRRAGSQSVGEISGRFPLAVVPADPTFVIWAPIYASSLALAGYAALPGRLRDPALRPLRLPAAIAYAGNALWVPAFTRERYRLALACILTTLGGSAVAYATAGRALDGLDTTSRAVVRAPLGLLFGWITVASPSAIEMTLLASDRTRLGLSPTAWALTAVGACTAVSGAVERLQPSSRSHSAAVAWGLAGVAAKRSHPTVVRAAAALAAGSLVTAIARRVRIR